MKHAYAVRRWAESAPRAISGFKRPIIVGGVKCNFGEGFSKITRHWGPYFFDFPCISD